MYEHFKCFNVINFRLIYNLCIRWCVILSESSKCTAQQEREYKWHDYKKIPMELQFLCLIELLASGWKYCSGHAQCVGNKPNHKFMLHTYIHILLLLGIISFHYYTCIYIFYLSQESDYTAYILSPTKHSFDILPIHTIIISYMFRPYLGHHQGERCNRCIQHLHTSLLRNANCACTKHSSMLNM